MFVLCPHCHFLVGMDPRTGGPPAACPKCGGTVVEPVAAQAVDAAPLDPFAPAALPSVAPTLAPEEAAGEAAKPAAAIRGAKATEVQRAKATPAAAPSGPADADPGGAAASPVATPVEPPGAAAPSPSRPSADDMIAALATRPERKPRAPRTRKKPAARAPVPASNDAGAAAAASAPAAATPPPAASAAAMFGARLRQLFARAPRQPAPAAGTPEPSPAAAADATPAIPPLSIRNRRRRPAPKDADAATATGEAAPARPATLPADDVPAPVAPMAESTAGGGAATTDAPADAVPVASTPLESPPLESPPLESTPLESPPVASETVEEAPAARTLADRTASGDEAVPAPVAPELPVAPPENVDAAASALVAAMPAQVAPTATTPVPARPAPSFATIRAGARSTRRDYRAIAAAVALAALLGLQLLLAQRAVLAADPGWRPTVAALCALLRCELPPWREPAAFTMLSRHVRPHPDAPGTLLIDASFRNEARWPQPWPRLELTLADVDGRTVGARTFEAREYLGAAPTQSELAPGQSASLSLAVVEPAPDIVSFTFDFR